MHMDVHSVKINKWLYPLSWLYGVGVGIRNMMFDKKIIHSKHFDIPIICIGNIAVGGTGKTPHTEYLIGLLQDEFNVAVLSRGYKRQTKGYLLAGDTSSERTIGDEPYQIKSKFRHIRVAVDEQRVRGIENLLTLSNPKIDVILLDDAFQHRYVEAGLNILLTDYHRLFSDDVLLPAGRLREPQKGKVRAQLVVVTKCPEDMKPIEFNIVAKRLKLYPYQKLFFSSLRYGKLTPVFPDEKLRPRALQTIREEESVLLVTGIASPVTIEKELRKYSSKVSILSFPDHHQFTERDMKQILHAFNAMDGKRVIVTTEKDATRLTALLSFPNELKTHIFMLPIEVGIMQGQEEAFNEIIINYVRKNQ